MIDFTTKQLSDSTAVVEVRGNLNESNREYFFDCIGDLLEAGTSHVVIECHRLGYLTSSGLAALLSARKRAERSESKIYLTHVNSKLAEVLQLTGLSRFFAVYPTTEDVLPLIANSAQYIK